MREFIEYSGNRGHFVVRTMQKLEVEPLAPLSSERFCRATIVEASLRIVRAQETTPSRRHRVATASSIKEQTRQRC
jgi:hypothetical protein